MALTFRQAVLARTKSEAATHTLIHLLFGAFPLVIGAGIGWWLVKSWSPAASLKEFVIVPVISGLGGLAATFLGYLAYLYLSKVPRLLWEESQASLQKAAKFNDNQPNLAAIIKNPNKGIALLAIENLGGLVESLTVHVEILGDFAPQTQYKTHF